MSNKFRELQPMIEGYGFNIVQRDQSQYKGTVTEAVLYLKPTGGRIQFISEVAQLKGYTLFLLDRKIQDGLLEIVLVNETMLFVWLHKTKGFIKRYQQNYWYIQKDKEVTELINQLQSAVVEGFKRCVIDEIDDPEVILDANHYDWYKAYKERYVAITAAMMSIDQFSEEEMHDQVSHAQIFGLEEGGA